MQRALIFVACLLTGLPSLSAQLFFPVDYDMPAERLEFADSARVLYVVAHPDDEDNGLLAYLRAERGVHCTLLTLTRGEGGQNEISSELNEQLAVLRMEELRQVHRVDGATQRFGRAFEFGYSFCDEETRRIWGEENIVRDLVQVIRELRPTAVLTMPRGGDAGGRHHQVSAQCTEKAVKLAALDHWPELGAPFAVARLWEQVWDENPTGEGLVLVPLNLVKARTGETYAELGVRARSHHRCQGVPQHALPGSVLRASRWRLVHSFTKDPVVAGELLPAGIGLTEAASKVRSQRESRRRAVQVLATARQDRAAPGESVAVRIHLRNPTDHPVTIVESGLEIREWGDRPSRQVSLGSHSLAPGSDKTLTCEVQIAPDATAFSWVTMAKEAAAGVYTEAPSRLPQTACMHFFAELDELDLGATWRSPVVHRGVDRATNLLRTDPVALLPVAAPAGFSLRRIAAPHTEAAYLLEPIESRPAVTPLSLGALADAPLGWISGPGADGMDGVLQDLGVEVRHLNPHALATGQLDGLRVIGVGVRAWKTREFPESLRRWMEEGGHLVCFLQKPVDVNPGEATEPSLYFPWPARLSARRVTDETSPVVKLDPKHRIWQWPNPLAEDPLQGWVQERGLYFLDTTDARYENLVLLRDSFALNPSSHLGALVQTRVGRGAFTYVALALYRQVLAGNPSGTQLAINILQPTLVP